MKDLLHLQGHRILLLAAVPILLILLSAVRGASGATGAARTACTRLNHSLWELPVSSLAFSPDGKTLASAYKKNLVRLWDVESGRAKADLGGHPDRITAIAITADGQTLVSGSDGDGATVRVWDLPAGTLRHTLLGHLDGVAAVAVTPDSRVAATAGADSIIRLWDLQTGRHMKDLRGHSGVVVSIAFSRDGATLASVAEPQDERVEGILLWDVHNGVMRSRFAPNRPLGLVAYSPDGKLLAATEGLDRIGAWIQVYDVRTQRMMQEVGVHATSIAFAPDGRTLAVGRYEHTIWLWELAADRLRSVRPGCLEGPTLWIESIAFSPDGRYLASGSNDLRLWDLRLGRLSRVFR